MEKQVRTKVLIVGDYTDKHISKAIAAATGIKQSVFENEDPFNGQLVLNHTQPNTHLELHFFRSRHFKRSTPPEVDVVLLVGKNIEIINQLSEHITEQQRYPFFVISTANTADDNQYGNNFIRVTANRQQNFLRLKNLTAMNRFHPAQFTQAIDAYIKNLEVASTVNAPAELSSTQQTRCI